MLEPGDHLTAAEFDRRYALRSDIQKAELVQGIIDMPSPVRINEHAEPDSVLTKSYRRAGVQEYVAWRTVDGAVDWFELVEGEYRRLEPGADGVTRSKVFPGLALHIEKLVAGEYAAAISPDRARQN